MDTLAKGEYRRNLSNLIREASHESRQALENERKAEFLFHVLNANLGRG